MVRYEVSEVSIMVPLVLAGMISTGSGVEAEKARITSPMRSRRMVQWLLGALSCLAIAACGSPDESGNASTAVESAQALSGLGGACNTICDCVLGATDCIGGTCQYRGFSPPNPQACGAACQCHLGDSCVNGGCVPSGCTPGSEQSCCPCSGGHCACAGTQTCKTDRTWGVCHDYGCGFCP
jgi:hypothetical protein